jgi:putative ABC transport system permease protein
MFKNYFKTAWRNIQSNKLFTVLNIAGLAIGLCVCILLFAFVSKELAFDGMFKNRKNIFRVNMETSEAYNYEKWAEIPNAVGPAMKQDIAQVKSATRLIKDDFGAPASLKVGDKNFVEKNLYLADSTVFQMFDFNFIEGNVHTVFSQPKSIVISQSAKERLFGNNTAIGKMIYVNSRDTLHVTGIFKDMPENSTIDCDMVYNIMDSWMGKNVSWSNASFETYIQLQPNANAEEIQKQATALINKYVAKEDQYYTKFILQPLSKIHLYSSDLRDGYSSRTGSINSVKSLLFLALLVLLIACINYSNLATARSQKRGKGVGVNKVLGANVRQMLMLFYMETGLLSLISIVIGLCFALLAIPLFQQITGAELTASNLFSLPVLLSLCIIWLIVTIVAGSYPAFSMSRISPLILMNKSKQRHSIADYIRKGLVIFQFAASIILIIAVLVIIQQMHFIRNKDLGYNPNGIVSLSIKSAESKDQIFRTINDLKELANIKSVSAVQSIPGGVESGRSVKRIATDKDGFPVSSCRTYGSIVETMQLKLLAGTDVPETISKEDTTCYTLINEVVANYLGFKSPEDAIGKKILTELGDKSIVTGVVKNFNYQSLKDEIGGYLYYKMNKGPESVRTLLVRYNSENLPQLLQQLQNVLKTDMPNTAFDYQFLDKHVQSLYASEQHTSNAATAFSLLAIFIACLGLFGLAAFTAEQRTKEIGVRKVLGASITGIAKLLSKDFLKLVALSFIIAMPVAWWIMNKWLEGFAYRININWTVFAIAGIVALLIALITVSFQAIKAALANPVDSLRSE